MKRSLLLSVIVAITLLAGVSPTLIHAQVPANDDKPTFYHFVPGTYVNGWPRCTVHYPKDWIERLPMPQEIFRASVPGPIPSPAFVFAPFTPPTTPSLPTMDKFADFVETMFKSIATDVTVLYDKPSRLRDGTPTREVELRCLLNGMPLNVLGVVAKRGDSNVNMGLESPNGKIGEDFRAVLYSVECEPGKENPVKVPSDVQKLLDKQCNDIVSGDVVRVMAHYSDKYLNSGRTKGEMERIHRQFFGSVTSCEVGITEFVPAGDKAYLTGFIITNFGKIPWQHTAIINEGGEWKWYGNQRNPAP
jgi:hypothetical protein